jgi:hypothetical protein
MYVGVYAFDSIGIAMNPHEVQLIRTGTGKMLLNKFSDAIIITTIRISETRDRNTQSVFDHFL